MGKKNLKFIGLGTGSNRTIIQSTGDIANGKGIWVFETPGTCDNPYIENIVFDGAQVSDANGGNGAGIRFQAKDITVKNCKFINCQNGILEGNGSVTTSNVMLLNSEFENNGYQLPNDPTHSGYEHHIYISASADTLWVENCYFHRPRGQANSLKTRAQRSYILYNLIDEEATGYGSWELNIAQGGLNVIVGNVIIQGTSGANHGMISYDAATNVLEDFYFVNNTVINKYVGAIKYFNVTPATGINTYKIYNNIFASVAAATNTIFSANVPSVLDSLRNIFAPNYLTLGFTNPSTNDYSLLPTATLAINTGTNAGTTNTAFSLIPNKAYQSFTTALVTRTISGLAIDRGAYEYYFPSTDISEKHLVTSFSIYPNPFNYQTIIKFSVEQKNTRILLMDVFGKEVRSIIFSGTQFVLEKNELSSGVYFVKIEDELRNSISKKLILE
ncbi:MAG: T9SS type A sorting domain-containing protein [Sphingobacteriaceae bacterium]|nr:T9SS type A sorting domain-containing protein [Sphingobacteriaceae bacterium]